MKNEISSALLKTAIFIWVLGAIGSVILGFQAGSFFDSGLIGFTVFVAYGMACVIFGLVLAGLGEIIENLSKLVNVNETKLSKLEEVVNQNSENIIRKIDNIEHMIDAAENINEELPEI